MSGNKADRIGIYELTKEYKDLVAVDKVSFEAYRGHPMAILGRNGAGKSTIIKMILGLISSTSGRIDIPAGFRVGYLPEERGAYQDVTVEDHLKLFAKLSGVKNISRAVDKWLNRFEIYNYRKFPIKSLSKGNAQKVQFAIALINEPDLLILDEPLSGLDPVSAQVVERIILEESQDKILVTTSHNMNYVEKLCENIILLNHGHQVVCGGINDIKRQYGKSKLEFPMSDEIKEQLRAYDLVEKEHMLVIEDVQGIEEFKKIINSIDCSVNTEFIRYGYENMEEIFIKLLGDNHV